MSLSNPNTVVTEQRLKDFYDGILPYLGGSADAGFTPVGTVISVMGVTAPANYLACNGQVVNIADYPELANYFYQQFGSKNKFGGNGTTTFGIPDLRGEFLRGTGTNSHANQGSGAAVGTHQDATEHIRIGSIGTTTTANAAALRVYANNSNKYGSNFDSSTKGTHYKNINQATTTSATEDSFYTARPTNTSVLYCIATKNIYLNPSLDYSTDEKVVGTWIDGKTLYQKTIVGTISVDEDGVSKNSAVGFISTDYDKLISIDAVREHSNGIYVSLNASTTLVDGNVYVCNLFASKTAGNLIVEDNRLADNGRNIIATVKYTKTTD